MYKGKRVSVTMPAYNEADGIYGVVREFLGIPIVDEVIVVDNNSTDGTAAIAREAGAKIVHEARQGYGYACRTALRAATGDYVLLAESDGTFQSTDIHKFLLYGEDFEVVFGTRTSKSCIWKGSNMGWFLRYGNWAVAKLLEYMHNGPCLTDVGCTFKLLRKEAVECLDGLWTVGGSHFSPELMITAVRSGLVCVEIPIHYRPRLGTSKITGSLWKAFRLGLRMIALVVIYRFKAIPKFVHSEQTPRAVTNVVTGTRQQ
jgi:glycosyltransferase involved in cell wall biosynthesis